MGRASADFVRLQSASKRPGAKGSKYERGKLVIDRTRGGTCRRHADVADAGSFEGHGSNGPRRRRPEMHDEAKRHYGGIYCNWGDVRESAYEHCMIDAGLPP
jgi:hypothetical protein